MIGWGVGELLARGDLIDLCLECAATIPAFLIHPSRKLPPAKVRVFTDFCVQIVGKL